MLPSRCHQMSWNIFQFNIVTFDDISLGHSNYYLLFRITLTDRFWLDKNVTFLFVRWAAFNHIWYQSLFISEQLSMDE